MFNLEDDEQDLLGFDEGQQLGGLTHGGRNVMDLQGDDFMAQGLGDDDEDDEERGTIGRRVVDRAHFGGFENGDEEAGEERKKSKQEVMAEVMAKSKEYKVSY
jgi:nucleolar protein 14